MPSAQEAREARRRKILARGSDRLAYIAGELPSISAASVHSSTAQNSYGSNIPSAQIPRSGDAALIRLTDPSSRWKPQEFQEFGAADFDNKCAARDTSSSEKRQEFQEFDTTDFEHKDRARVIEDVGEDSRPSQDVQDFDVLEEVPNPNLVSPQTRNDVNSVCLDEQLDRRTTGLTKGWWSATSWMTWDGIAYSIDATENLRALGAVLLAVIAVVYSFDGTKLEGKFLSNWILPWPVALVIVTDISLVSGALLLGLVRIPSLIKPADVPEVRELGTAQDQLRKVSEISSQLECYLEVGTVVFKTFRALFLDCSIYAVSLIGGYILGQNWQSASLY